MRKQIQQENIASAKVPTKKNIANLLTKPLYGTVIYSGNIWLLASLLFMPMSKSEWSTGVGDFFTIYDEYFIERECLIYERDCLFIRLSWYVFPENHM